MEDCHGPNSSDGPLPLEMFNSRAIIAVIFICDPFKVQNLKRRVWSCS